MIYSKNALDISTRISLLFGRKFYGKKFGGMCAFGVAKLVEISNVFNSFV